MKYFLLFFLNIVFGYNFKYHFFGRNFNNNNKVSLIHVHDLMEQNRCYGYLSTLCYSNKLKGYPYTSLVGVSLDEKGYPLLSMSDISQHTKNINKNNSISLLIPEKGLISSREKRVTFTGNINKVIDEYEKNYLKDLYLKSHENAYWLKYIDFNMYRMDNIKDIYYIGGFGKATKISVEKYLKKYIKYY